MSPDWYCEKLHCLMLKTACDRRRELALITTMEGQIYRDAGCLNCQQITTKGVDVEDATEKVCRKCGESKPLKDFDPNKECKLGCEGTCKNCKKQQQKSKYEQKKLAKPTTIPSLAQRSIDMTLLPISITLDMTDYPDLYDKIKTVAQKDFRSMAMQVLYWVDRCIEDKEA
jgi:hypothetical protein